MGIFYRTLVCSCETFSSLQWASTILDEVLTNCGLCINVSKYRNNGSKPYAFEDEYPGTIISLLNVPLQNSTKFKYIGSYIPQNELNMGHITINHRIQMAYAKFAIMANLLPNSKIHLKIKVKFLNRFFGACSHTYAKTEIQLWVSLKTWTLRIVIL